MLWFFRAQILRSVVLLGFVKISSPLASPRCLCSSTTATEIRSITAYDQLKGEHTPVYNTNPKLYLPKSRILLRTAFLSNMVIGASPQSGTASPARFFRLPRELRDQIYDMLSQTKKVLDNGVRSDSDFKMQSPISDARLVSRQFKLEYDMRPSSKLRLLAVDTGFHLNSGTRIPDFAKKARSLEVSWVISDAGCVEADHRPDESCAFANRQINGMRDITAFVDRLPLVDGLDITISVHPHPCVKELVSQIAKIPVVANLEVLDRFATMSGVTSHYAVWSRERGLFKDNTDGAKPRARRLAILKGQRAECKRRQTSRPTMLLTGGKEAA